jgi:hypothetical protein
MSGPAKAFARAMLKVNTERILGRDEHALPGFGANRVSDRGR